MNKTIAVLALLSVLAASARAATISAVCGRFMEAGQIRRCLSAAAGRRADPKALDICNRFVDGGQIIGCVAVVSGRVYAPGEAEVCDRFWDGGQIMSCLSAAGRPYRPADGERCDDGRSARELVADCKARFSTDADRLNCVEAGLGL